MYKIAKVAAYVLKPNRFCLFNGQHTQSKKDQLKAANRSLKKKYRQYLKKQMNNDLNEYLNHFNQN